MVIIFDLHLSPLKRGREANVILLFHIPSPEIPQLDLCSKKAIIHNYDFRIQFSSQRPKNSSQVRLSSFPAELLHF